MKRLVRSFYTRPALTVARDILGKRIARVHRGRKIIGKIVEVEVYYSSRDRASHAFGGKVTERGARPPLAVLRAD